MERDQGNSSRWLSWLGILSDPARLRMLRLLQKEELGVGELARAIQMPQSTVSRHLKPLHDGGWVVRRSEGTASMYRMIQEDLPAEANNLWNTTLNQVDLLNTFRNDDDRLREVVNERPSDTRQFFGARAGDWSALRQQLYGGAFTDEALLGLVNPEWTVGDLGCGSGDVSERLSPLVRNVISIDREAAMLDAARNRLSHLSNIDFRAGELLALPIDDNSLDAAVLMLVLQHVPDPLDAIKEVARVTRPGGLILLVDLVPHDRENYRFTMGHLHMGFDQVEAASWAEKVDGTLIYRRLHPDTQGQGPVLFAASIWL